MKRQRRTNSISKATQALLSQGENEFVDFKRTPDSVTADDLVAFANTDSGGTILVGIDEQTSADGTQCGIVKGCDVGDGAILQILNKAISCVPPVGVTVHVENLKYKPFLRLVVSSSESKPHCTPKGVYCRRDGSRNRAMHPAELLKIFLEIEARAFAERFESTTDRIARDLGNLETTLESSIKSMADQLGWAESQLGDTESTLGSILAYVHRIDGQAKDTATRLRTLFRQDRREDPVRGAVRKEVLDSAVKQLSENRALLDQLRKHGTAAIQIGRKSALELDDEDLRSIMAEAVAIATDKQEAERYAIEVKSPSKVTEEELDRFAALVMAGGEVAKGLRQRLASAAALGFLKYDGKIVGTAALKRPAPGYHSRVFKKAESKHSVTEYPLELGWVYLETAHRRKRRMPSFIDAILKHANESGVFATVRILNERMLDILIRHGFVRDGSTYASKQTPGEEVGLFLRAPKSAKLKSSTK